MINIPLNLGLRDLNIEVHNVTGKDVYVYNRTRHLMIRLIDVVNGLDPSLHAYMDVFRNMEREVVFQNDQFLIQYDGLRKGDHMYQEHWRLIWRDVAIQWYKHPKRALEATREISHAEEAMLVAEFREAMKGFVVYKPQAQRDAETELKAAERLADKLYNNGVSGKMLPRSLSGQPYELHDYQQPIADALMRGDHPGLHNQKFGRLSPNPEDNIPPTSLQEMIADIRARRGQFNDKWKTVLADHMTRKGPIRMTQGKFGDYEAAAAGAGPSVKAAWEAIKADGIEIVPYEQLSEGEKLGVGDLSVMFMYPHEISPIDMSKFKGPNGPVNSMVIDPIGYLDLDGNPRPDFDMESIRPQGKRISDEIANLPTLEDITKSLGRSSLFPEFAPNAESMAEGLEKFQRKQKMLDHVMQGKQLTTPQLLELLDTQHVFYESPEVRAIRADIDPAPPIDEETLRAYGLEKKDAGTAPAYFITAARPQAQPKLMAFMIKLALYMKYVAGKEEKTNVSS